MDPRFAIAYNNRGNAWAKKDNPGAAIRDYTEAIRLDPQYGLAYYNRGLVYRKQGNEEAATRDFHEANVLAEEAKR